MPIPAAEREQTKIKKYAAHLPQTYPSPAFTPSACETYGSFGPATATFLFESLGGPGRNLTFTTLLTDAYIILWRTSARSVLAGYASSHRPGLPGGDVPPRRAQFSSG